MPIGPNPDLSPVCRVWPSTPQPGQAGFTKSSTMASALSLNAILPSFAWLRAKGFDLSDRFILAATAIAGLPARNPLRADDRNS